MSDGYFEVTFSPDPENHEDFAFRWQGRPGTRGRANMFATSAAKSAWYTFSSAMGRPQSALPEFISVKNRTIREGNIYQFGGWSINRSYFKMNIDTNNLQKDVLISDKLNYYHFLMSRINFLQTHVTRLETNWQYTQKTTTFQYEIIPDTIEIQSFIDICSHFEQSNDYSTLSNAINSILVKEAILSSPSEIKVSKSYMFDLSSLSATLRAAKLFRYSADGARLASHFRSQGNKDLAKRMEAWAARPAPKEFQV